MKKLLLFLIVIILMPFMVFASELELDSNITVVSSSEGVIVNSNSLSKSISDFDLTFTGADQKATLNIKILNNGDKPIKILSYSLPSSDNNITYEIDSLTKNEIIEAHKTKTFQLEISSTGELENSLDFKDLQINYEETEIVEDDSNKDNQSGGNTIIENGSYTDTSDKTSSSGKTNAKTGAFINIALLIGLAIVASYLIFIKKGRFLKYRVFIILTLPVIALLSVKATTNKVLTITGIIRTGKDTKLIIINPNKGTYQGVSSYVYESAQVGSTFKLDTPIYDNYVLSYWDDGTNKITTGSFEVTDDVMVKAMWDYDKYEVCYNDDSQLDACDEAKISSSSKITIRSLSVVPTGKVFDSWNTKADGTGDKYEAGKQVSYADTGKKLELYPIYTNAFYKVTYNASPGVMPEKYTTEYEYTKTYNDIPVPTITGLTDAFKDWKCTDKDNNEFILEEKTSVYASDITCNAEYNITSINVTFIIDDETSYTYSYIVGLSFDKLPEVSKPGYNLGWFTEKNGKGTEITSKTIVEEDMEYVYANFTAITPSVSYYDVSITYKFENTSDGNYDVSFTKSMSVAAGDTVSASYPEKKDFDKYNINSDYFDEPKVKDVTGRENESVTYEYKRKRVSVTFNNGLSSSDTDTVTNMPDDISEFKVGATLGNQNEPTRTDYDFAGWTSTSSCADAKKDITGDVITSDTTYTACWLDNTRNISFDFDGGSWTDSEGNTWNVSTYTTTYNSSLKFPEPTKTGKVLDYWLDTDSNQKYDANNYLSTKDDINLKAIWKDKVYTITFVLPTGGNTWTTETCKGDNVTLSGGVCTKTIKYGETFGSYPIVKSDIYYGFKEWLIDEQEVSATTVMNDSISTDSEVTANAVMYSMKLNLVSDSNSKWKDAYDNTTITSLLVEKDYGYATIELDDKYDVDTYSCTNGYQISINRNDDNTYGVKIIKGYEDLTNETTCTVTSKKINELYYMIEASALGNETNISHMFDFSSEYLNGHDYNYQSGVYSGTFRNNPIYYYWGDVDNNNVVFANKCWKILSVTKDYQIFKLLYFGEVNTDGTCPSSVSGINNSKEYNFTDDDYNIKITTDDYDTLKLEKMQNGAKYDYVPQVSSAGTRKDSIAKEKLEEWYEDNLLNYSDALEDYGFCNNYAVSYSDLNQKIVDKTVDQYYYANYSYINGGNKRMGSCPAEYLYTVSSDNGNGRSKYPIGLLEMEDLLQAGLTSLSEYKNSNYAYLNAKDGDARFTNNTYFLKDFSTWTMSPTLCTINNDENPTCWMGVINSLTKYFTAWSTVDSTSGLNPVIYLKQFGTQYKSGTGTLTDPYILEVR